MYHTYRFGIEEEYFLVDAATKSPACEMPAAFLEADEEAGRVLKIRHDVKEGDPPPCSPLTCRHPLEIVEIDPVGLLRDACERGLCISKGRDRSRIRGQLHEDDVSRIDEHPGDTL